VADIERLSRFYQSGFDEAGFRPIPVPSNWSLQGFEEPAYGRLKPTASEGFYVHTFQAPAGFRGKRVLLHFDGVWQSAEVWLNGQPLGRHDSGFTAFAFDISKVVVPGTENRLAVRVRQFAKDYLFDTNDDWSLPGMRIAAGRVAAAQRLRAGNHDAAARAVFGAASATPSRFERLNS
jgi:beta-galactosidase